MLIHTVLDIYKHAGDESGVSFFRNDRIQTRKSQSVTHSTTLLRNCPNLRGNLLFHARNEFLNNLFSLFLPLIAVTSGVVKEFEAGYTKYSAIF